MFLGAIKTASYATKVQGKILDSDSVRFWPNPGKINLPYWFGHFANGIITGTAERSTGGPATPQFRGKFIATRKTF